MFFETIEQMARVGVMPIHQQAIRALKRRIIKGGRRPTRVVGGLTRGCWMMLDPLLDLQRQFGLYEFETRRVVRRLVVPGSIVFDIGAGDGYESLAYARLGARVYAFDPDQTAVAKLRENIELNPGLVAQISVFMQRFSPSDLLPQADFAKIDVDGGERELLEDLLDVPAMLIETHSASLEAACASFLSDHGYQTTVIPNARWRVLYPEWRPIEHNRWLLAERRSTWRGQATPTNAGTAGD